MKKKIISIVILCTAIVSALFFLVLALPADRTEKKGKASEGGISAGEGASERELPHGEGTEEKMLRLTVLIRNEDSLGSGLLLQKGEEYLLIATTAHVLADWNDDSRILFPAGGEKREPVPAGRAERIFSEENPDLALLKVALSDKESRKAEEPFRVNLDLAHYESLRRNDLLFLPDMTGTGQEAVIRKGAVVDKCRYIEEYGCEMLYADGEAVPGMSGCGIFDAGGNPVGILSGATDSYELAGIPLHTLLNMLKELQ